MSSYYIHCAPQQIADIKKPTLGGLNSSGWVKHAMVHLSMILSHGWGPHHNMSHWPVHGTRQGEATPYPRLQPTAVLTWYL